MDDPDRDKKPAAHCFEHPEEMTEINEMVKIGG